MFKILVLILCFCNFLSDNLLKIEKRNLLFIRKFEKSYKLVKYQFFS
jgi:hypothetical protein